MKLFYCMNVFFFLQLCSYSAIWGDYTPELATPALEHKTQSEQSKIDYLNNYNTTQDNNFSDNYLTSTENKVSSLHVKTKKEYVTTTCSEPGFFSRTFESILGNIKNIDPVIGTNVAINIAILNHNFLGCVFNDISNYIDIVIKASFSLYLVLNFMKSLIIKCFEFIFIIILINYALFFFSILYKDIIPEKIYEFFEKIISHGYSQKVTNFTKEKLELLSKIKKSVIENPEIQEHSSHSSKYTYITVRKVMKIEAWFLERIRNILIQSVKKILKFDSDNYSTFKYSIILLGDFSYNLLLSLALYYMYLVILPKIWSKMCQIKIIKSRNFIELLFIIIIQIIIILLLVAGILFSCYKILYIIGDFYYCFNKHSQDSQYDREHYYLVKYISCFLSRYFI